MALRAIPPAPTESAAERRQLTVMFCDLVDSTVLSTLLDPEDHHEVLRTYQRVCAKVIARYDGYLAQFLGDGIMAYFGYPKAHEDDAERSVLAALGILEEVAKIDVQNLKIRTRVGIATGLVVVGDKIAKGRDWEVGVVGDTPNLAARIQGLAQPGTVVIGSVTRQLLGGQFEYEDLGSHPLKGFAQPLPVWRVVAERRVENRFKASRASYARIIDRRAEQALLKDLGERAVKEACQTVLICGEAGIGKSRLASALVEWMGEQGSMRLVEMQCSAHHTQSALFPAINALWQVVFQGERQRDGDLAWERLERFLGDTLAGEADAALPLFANLMSIPAPAGWPASALPPEQQRQLMLRYLLDLFAQCGGGRPVLLLMEDLHWADPSTLEFVEYLVEHGSARRLLALFTSRSEFAPPWLRHPQVTVVPLSRLPNEDAADLVRQTLGEQGLAEEVIESVVAKTDGIPLYLQEYTKAVAESGSQDNRRVCVIPSSLHDLLLARLDRLGEAKVVAQTAALLGREFDGKLLEAVCPLDSHSFSAGLELLLKEEVVYAKGDASLPRYVFRHALIQDAAYESLLKSNRAVLHLRIGEAVERDFPDISETQPEWLAQHFSHAGLPLRAIPHWERAGQRAVKLAAFAEADGHFEAALAQVAKLPEEPSRHGLELGLQLQLGLALSASLGYAAGEVEAAYQRARELCGLLGDTAELFPVLRGLVNFYIVRGDLAKSLALSEQCMRLGHETGRLEYKIEARNALGYTLAYLGEIKRGAEVIADAIRIYQAHDGERFDYPSPHNPYMGCLSILALLTWMLGEARQSMRHSQELEAVLQQRGSPFDKAYGYGFLAMLESLRGRFEIAARHAADASDISRRFGYSLWLEVGNANLALTKGFLTGQAEWIVALRESINNRRDSGSITVLQFYYIQLAELYRRAGEPWLALAAIEEAFATGCGYGELWFTAEHHRIRGELLMALGEQDRGMADVHEAVKLARGQGAKLFLLRAALSLCRLAQDAAGPDSPRALLEEAVRQIDPEDGALMPEWQEAVQILDPKNSHFDRLNANGYI